MLKLHFITALFFFVSVSLKEVLCYPSYLMDEEGCSKSLAEGEMMMGKAIKLDDKKTVEIVVTKADGSKYSNGDMYIPGEKVDVTLIGVKGYHVLETDAGSFGQGKCFGKRTASKNPSLQLPQDAKEVNLLVGWAKGYGAVKLSSTFTLMPPAEEKIEELSVLNQETEKKENKKLAARPGNFITKMENIIEEDSAEMVTEAEINKDETTTQDNEGMNRKRKLRFQ
jgi:hypothetical protein